MTTWFTSDTHYNHEAIIVYCKRPYERVSQMNYDIIRRWNECVSVADVIFHLGDFALSDPALRTPIIAQLNGRKILIRGNHDKKPELMLEAGFEAVHENVVVPIDGKRVWMNHYPYDAKDERTKLVRPTPPSTYDAALCGHNHENGRFATVS